MTKDDNFLGTIWNSLIACTTVCMLTHVSNNGNFLAQVIHNERDESRCTPGDGYCNLSVHYHMLLELFFDCLEAPRLLFLEKDLEIAPDFFSYFAAMAPVLDADQSLMCVSAWNDHGQSGRASNTSAAYRTDIFPGLGWMLTRPTGLELAASWPDKYWDEYMRRPLARKGRQCIFPEVSRTRTYGAVGASGGQLYDTHLSSMLLNQDRIDWSEKVRKRRCRSKRVWRTVFLSLGQTVKTTGRPESEHLQHRITSLCMSTR